MLVVVDAALPVAVSKSQLTEDELTAEEMEAIKNGEPAAQEEVSKSSILFGSTAKNSFTATLDYMDRFLSRAYWLVEDAFDTTASENQINNRLYVCFGEKPIDPATIKMFNVNMKAKGKHNIKTSIDPPIHHSPSQTYITTSIIQVAF